MLKVEIILGIVASSIAITAFLARASALTDRNLQFEALQILKEAPPQIVFLPAGQGNLLDPSTFLKSRLTQP